MSCNKIKFYNFTSVGQHTKLYQSVFVRFFSQHYSSAARFQSDGHLCVLKNSVQFVQTENIGVFGCFSITCVRYLSEYCALWLNVIVVLCCVVASEIKIRASVHYVAKSPHRPTGKKRQGYLQSDLSIIVFKSGAHKNLCTIWSQLKAKGHRKFIINRQIY